MHSESNRLVQPERSKSLSQEELAHLSDN